MAQGTAEDAVAAKLARLEAAAPTVLQKYGKQPPGDGLGVVYAAICTVNGKMYTGQHAHGVSGKSAYAARWKAHERSKEFGPFPNAMRKYGKDAFKWYILDHCLEDDLNDQEIATIAKWGTQVPFGYNQEKGGGGAPKSHRGLEALRIANRKEDRRTAIGALSKARWEDDDYREKTVQSMKEAQNKPERRLFVSNSSKARWAEDDYREKTVESMKEAANKPERLLQKSNDTAKRWSDPDYHEKTVASMKAAQSTPAAREANRKKAQDFWDQPENKEQMRSKAKKRALDNGSIQQKTAGEAAWANPESVERIKASRRAMWKDPAYAEKRWNTFLQKREETLEACKTPQERKRKAMQYAQTDKLRAQRMAADVQKY